VTIAAWRGRLFQKTEYQKQSDKKYSEKGKPKRGLMSFLFLNLVAERMKKEKEN